MKSGKCPKCGSSHIVTVPGNDARFQGYRKAITLGWFSWVWTDDYICAGCGYVENYINEKDKHKIVK